MASNPVDKVFVDHVLNIKNLGTTVSSRNASINRLLNLSSTFNQTPLVTIRRTAWKNALREMEWFLSGSSDIADLHPKVHSWWKPWANSLGFISNNYSKQFRRFRGSKGATLDQVQYMIDTLKDSPGSRRNVITTWNTADMVSPDTPITNCHGTVIQAFVNPNDNTVHLTMYQRSADMMLGVPHNWIQYWAFMLYISHLSGRNPGSLTWIGGDCHVYPDHIEMVDKLEKEMVKLDDSHKVPNLIYNPTSHDFKADDFTLDSYYNPVVKKSLKMTV